MLVDDVDDGGAAARAGLHPGDVLQSVDGRPLDRPLALAFALEDLSALMAEVHDLYQPLAEDRAMALTLDAAPGLQVLGERSLIAQLLSNLLYNAMTFCRPGDSIAMPLSAGGDRLVMTLADTGPGLSQAQRAEITRRFVRAERDRDVAGHGLGLALVRAIATRHGAKPTLPASEKGFRIEIAWPKLSRD